jgi:microsomal dipeptidase-like Zn-dependent dipeptidase
MAQQSTIDLSGVIDFHVHAGPDSRPRSLNDYEAARLANAAGMRGIVLKNHFTMTSDRAALAMALVDGLEIFGGVALNRAVGGINPEAVRQMVAFDGGRGKVVWLPTFDAEFYVTRAGQADAFVRVIEAGEPVPALNEVFELIAEHELVLAMGHSSPEEVLLLIPAAKKSGVARILVTHVFGQDATPQQMQQMAVAGAIMELDWLAAYSGAVAIDDYVAAIRQLGAENFLISSDFGQAENPNHATGMAAFILALQQRGVTESEIDIMARRNPAMLLGLD